MLLWTDNHTRGGEPKGRRPHGGKCPAGAQTMARRLSLTPRISAATAALCSRASEKDKAPGRSRISTPLGRRGKKAACLLTQIQGCRRTMRARAPPLVRPRDCCGQLSSRPSPRQRRGLPRFSPGETLGSSAIPSEELLSLLPFADGLFLSKAPHKTQAAGVDRRALLGGAGPVREQCLRTVGSMGRRGRVPSGLAPTE